jgi:hypothetical protein
MGISFDGAEDECVVMQVRRDTWFRSDVLSRGSPAIRNRLKRRARNPGHCRSYR